MNTTPASNDEELVRFLSAPAPRLVPDSISRGALREAAPPTLFLIGFVFLALGLVLAKVFLPWRQLDEWRLAASHPATATGAIVSVGTTGMKINGTRVVRYAFEFTPAGGAAPVLGECFTTGRRWSAGDRVRVRYAPGRPALACPAGARLSEASPVVVVALIFPIVGACLVFFSARARRRAFWLLQNGALGDFRVTGVEPTGAKVNNQSQFKVTLQRVDQTDADPHEARWYKPELVAFARERQANGQAVFGLFDPAKPRKVLLPEAWLRRK